MASWNPFLPADYRQQGAIYQKQIFAAIENGDFEPYIWPYHSFGIYAILIYLMLPPSNSKVIYYAKYPVFAFFLYWSWKAITETKAVLFPLCYGVGLVHMWCVIWFTSLIIFNDARTELRRIEEVPEKNDRNSNTGHDGQENTRTTSRPANGNELKHRIQHRSTLPESNANGDWPGNSGQKYYWQTLPTNFYDRIGWLSDLICSFRGPGWAHQIRTIPSPPSYITSSLPSPSPPSTLSVSSTYASTSTLIRANLLKGCIWYLSLDAIKVIMMEDPYFWGAIEAPAPAYLPRLIQMSPFLTHVYRLLVSLAGISVALRGVFALSPLFFVGLFGRNLLGLRGEAWQYSDFFGSPAYLFTDGLAGWWGAWWHQVFRLGFEAPSKFIVKKFGLDKRSVGAKMLSLFLAFVCSGSLHAAGSFTSWPRSYPLSGSFMFFMLQAVGIIAETVILSNIKSSGVQNFLPQWFRRGIHFTVLMAWMYYTSPLLVDDFSRAGLWFTEPIPISPFRGLGFGLKSEGWYVWNRYGIRWHTGDRWWKSGLAF